MSKLYIVGIGPGSEEYLTVKAKNTVESSDILIGSKRALDLFKDDIQKIELNAKNMENMMKEAVQLVKEGKSVSLLSTGDPGFSGILKPIMELNEDIDAEIIPGISSVQLCAAKLKMPWDDANLVTLHGKGTSEYILDVIDNGKPTIILPNFNPAELADFLIKKGINKERKVAICERLSYDDEKVVETFLKNISEMKFSYMCVVVIY